MEDLKTVTLTVSEFIIRISKELKIEGTKGVLGNELELIALVRNCQFLYDKNLSDFKDIQKKNEAWEAIANVFSVSVGEVQTRWKSMRDSFNKCKNKPDSDEASKKLICPFYDDMKFLLPYILPRRNYGRLNVSSTSLDDDSDESYPKKYYVAQKLKTDETLSIIKKVKSLPVLYHHLYSGATSRSQRIEGWKQVSAEFGMSVKDCLARWTSLREKYAKEKRNMDDNDTVSKWPLFNELSFLGSHIKRRRRFSRISSFSSDHITFKLSSPATSPTSEAIIIDSTFLNEVPSPDKREDIEFFSCPSDVMNFEQEQESSSISEAPQADSCSKEKILVSEDDLFGQTIAAELKHITCQRQKIKLKSEIYKLIYEYSCESS